VKPLYVAIEEKDGTLSILDVPIFSEVRKGEKNAPEDIDAKWMSRAIDAGAQLERQQKYLPPLHIGHHGQDPDVRAAGHFRLRRIAYMPIEGETRAVVTADLIKLSREVFDDIMAGKYPYRSVEIIDWNEPRINHLALLSHREPFFKFPLLNGDTVRLKDMKEVQMSATDGKKVAILFHETEEATVPNPTPKTAPPVKEKKGWLQKLRERIEAAFADAADSGADGDAGTVVDEDEDADVEALLAEINELSDDEFEALLAELDEEEGADDDGPDQSPQPAELDPRGQGRLSAVEAKVAALEAEKRTGALAAKAKADLAGYHLTAGTLKRIETFAAMGDDGKALREFVASFKEHAPKEPQTLDAEAAAQDPALAKLNLSPDDARLAIQFSKDYDEGRARGYVSDRVSKESYIKVQLAAAKAAAEGE
jgi:hypothetical protein